MVVVRHIQSTDSTCLRFLGIHMAAMQLQVSAARDLSLGRIGKGVDEAMTKIDGALSRLCSDLGAAIPRSRTYASEPADDDMSESGTAITGVHITRLDLPDSVGQDGLKSQDQGDSCPTSWEVRRLARPSVAPSVAPSLGASCADAERSGKPTDTNSNGSDDAIRGFAVLPVWQDAMRKARENRTEQGEVDGDNRAVMSNAAMSFLDYGEKRTPKRRRTGTKVPQRQIDVWLLWIEMRLWGFIVNPNSSRRIAWDVSSLFCVMYDLFIIPLQLFDPPESWFTTGMGWTTRIFWSFDMIASSITGYLSKDGSVELHPLKVICRYLQTWFLLDFVIVAVDWAELLLGSTNGNLSGIVRFGKASRTFRVLRMLRLIRLVRLRQIMQQFSERVQSEQLVICMNLAKLMALICSAAHILSCMWYGIGTAPPDDFPRSWVTENDLVDRTFWYKYTTSLHWAFSQFTGGMENIVPVNINERVFAIFALMLAFVGATVFMSSLTSWLTQLHILWSKQSQQFSMLRRYLGQTNVSPQLAMRVQRNAQFVLFERAQNTPEEAVELLEFISEPLRMELHFEMYFPIFSPHPFLGRYMRACPQVMRKVCHQAARTILVAHGDVIFHAGESPSEPRMYFLLSGQLQYIPSVGDCDIIDLEPGDWISEATLWVDWTHRGLLKAVADGQMCTLSAERFQQIVGTFEHDSEFTPGWYAEGFVENLNACPAEEVLDVARKASDECVDTVKTWFTAAFARRRDHRIASPSPEDTGDWTNDAIFPSSHYRP